MTMSKERVAAAAREASRKVPLVQHGHELMIFDLGMALLHLRLARRWLAGIETIDGPDVRERVEAAVRHLETFPEIVAEADELEDGEV
jgi:hypothetical protein